MAFYVVDGTDGSGKSTVAALLKGELEASGRSVCVTEHPNTGWFAGRVASGMLLRDTPVSGPIVTLAFFADLVHSVYRMKCTSTYDDFVFVRYTMSVCHLPDLVSRLLRSCLRVFFMKPDLALFVDVPAERAMERIADRGGEREIYENLRDVEDARSRMLAMAAEEGWETLDNSGSQDDVRRALCSILSIRAFKKS